MNKQQQRIAIAKTIEDKIEWHDDVAYWKGAWSAVGAGNEYLAVIDPLSDLNVMHEAEKTLTDEQQIRFIRILCKSDVHYDECNALMPERNYDRESFVIDHLHGLGWDEVWCYCLRATAAQRAEAFLRTLNLWVD